MRGMVFISALAALVAAAPVAAKPVTDCPLRDAPFSTSSPLIDILLSPEANAILSKAMPGHFDKLPPNFAGTEPPSFAAILDLKTAARFVGGAADSVAALDAPLRALPVTAADKVARCARYDNDVPKFDLPKGKPRLLLFEKINGFRDGPSVDAAHAAFMALAARKGWAIVATQSGGAFNTKTLAQFDAVIWNNISGDVLTMSQRKAFQAYLARGGAFVGVHGSAGDPIYFWDWYPDTLIGARFAGHPRNPQFQEARVVVADPASPLAKGLPAEWKLTDEWYSFKTSPRTAGAKVLLTLDEASYNPNDPAMPGLVMGSDHPIAWTNCIGRGRMFYSAIGHRPEMYSDPTYVTVLENAMGWAIDRQSSCASATPTKR
jgi:uncharacterized protein